MRTELLDEFVESQKPTHGNFRDITGQTFGRLTAVSYAGMPNWRWNWQCVCGNKVAVTGGSLKNGTTQSCGCLHSETTKRVHTTHGESGRLAGTLTPEYRSYLLAKGRCTNPTDHAWSDYGGRGITFLFTSYQEFLSALGRKPSADHSLDRIDVNGPYSPENCRWATWKQQQRNRRNNRLITLNGETHCQSEWAEMYGISTKRIHARRTRGWCDTCAITVPLTSGDGCPHRK